jgi:hypothetical protein
MRNYLLILRTVLAGLMVVFFLTGNAVFSLADESGRIGTLENEVRDLKSRLSKISRPKTRTDYDLPSLKIHTDNNNFTLGGVDLVITSKIAKKLSFLNETVFEFGADGANILDIERVLLKYEAYDWLNITMGRGHTALGYWNQRFHHGTWLQTTTDRPLIYAFEDDGGILPIHYVGLEGSGYVLLPFGQFHYYTNVANGRGKITDEVQLVEDANNEKMFSFMFSLEPTILEGFGFGANILFDVIPQNPSVAGRQNQIDETIAGAHLYYTDNRLEMIAEVQFIKHNETRDYYHNGGYAQLAYRFGKLKPYYRYDFLNIAGGDPYFAGLAGVEDSDQHTAGIKYEWFPYAAIKVEYRYLDSETVNSNALTAQVSFAF